MSRSTFQQLSFIAKLHEDNHVGDHGIVERIRVLGDVEVLLDLTPRIRKERPVRADSGAIFIRLCDIVGGNRNQPAIGNL
jgi:hypothetical protein